MNHLNKNIRARIDQNNVLNEQISVNSIANAKQRMDGQVNWLVQIQMLVLCQNGKKPVKSGTSHAKNACIQAEHSQCQDMEGLNVLCFNYSNDLLSHIQNCNEVDAAGHNDQKEEMPNLVQNLEHANHCHQQVCRAMKGPFG